jgi:adenosylhomocysteine nucleosidase
MIAVTFALSAESSDFVKLLENPRFDSDGGVETIRGSVHGKTVAVIRTGVGEKTCRSRLETVLGREKFDYLISAGFAGALERELRVGNLLVAENLSSPELLQSPHLDIAGDEVFVGKLLTVAGMVDSSGERDRLAAETGAVAVDMETKFIAELCGKYATPLLSLRAISDTSLEPFPAPPEILFDLEKQKTDYARLAIYLLTHPGAVPRLNAFRRRIALARKNLTAALEKILQADLL